VTHSSIDVLLSITMLRPEEASLLGALRNRGLNVSSALSEDIGNVLNGQAAKPSMALVRNVSHREASSIASRLSEIGVRVVNSVRALDLCFDKGKQALFFEQNRISHPQSYHAFSHSQVRSIVAEMDWLAVIKPLSGSWGRGVTSIESEKSLAAWVGGVEAVDPSGRLFPVLVQEYIDKPGYDLRVIVVGTEPVVAIRRWSNGLRTNTYLGARVESTEVTTEMRGLCQSAAAPLGPGFYGVDLIEDRRTRKLSVLEINATPEFARSSGHHEVDISALVAEHLHSLLEADTVGH
jgi:[lysine-biosynthesis-protein LysW]---L-2-aminoadipate ligase